MTVARGGLGRRWRWLGVGACWAVLGMTGATAQASKFAYVGDNWTNSVVPFSIGTGDLLAALAPASLTSGADPYALAATPDGRYVYAVDNFNNEVDEFAVNPDGTLTSLGQVTGLNSPSDIAVSPDGHSVYVASSDVVQFSVGADGRLTPKTDATVLAGSAYSVVVSPDGRHAYAANDAAGTISQYDVAADGSLTPMATPAVATGAASTNVIYLAMTPDGRSLYGVVNAGTTSQVAQLAVGADGALTPKSPAAVGTGSTPWGAAVSPDGRSLWVATYAGISQYDIGPDGALSAKSPAIVTGATGGRMLWPTADGATVYAPNPGNDGVDQLDVSPGGTLSLKSPPSASTGDPSSFPEGIVVLPDQAPVASFAAGSAVAGAPTGFDGSGSGDSDGSVARYDWDFGDGTTAVDADAHPAHTFAAPGTYTVRLTVTDDAGCSMTQVYAGHAAYCAGRPAATTTRSVTVVPAPVVGPPRATTGRSEDVGLHTVMLTGSVTANGEPTTYRFEYGRTTSYSSKTAAIAVAAHASGVAVAQKLRGLTAGRTYHYRLVATNARGTSTGADRTFATPRAVRALTVDVRPRRAQRAPYRYRFAGRLVLPRGMKRSTGCRGRVAIEIKSGSHTVSVGRATITSACTWRFAAAVNSGYLAGDKYRRLGRHGQLRVTVQFLGNRALARYTARPLAVRFG